MNIYIDLFVPTNALRQFVHCFLYYYDDPEIKKTVKKNCLSAFVGTNNSVIKRFAVNIKCKMNIYSSLLIYVTGLSLSISDAAVYKKICG